MTELSLDRYEYPDEEATVVEGKIKTLNQCRKAITYLEQELERFRLKAASIERDLAQYRIPSTQVTTVHYPAGASIQRCPNEILCLVFQQYLLPESCHSRIRRLLLVCRRWHNVIMANPRLWAQVQIRNVGSLLDYPERSITSYISACVKRSNWLPMKMHIDLSNIPEFWGYLPRKIYAYASNLVDSSQQEHLKEALFEACDLEITCPSYWEEVKSILSSIFGCLEQGIRRCTHLYLSLPEQYSLARHVLPKLHQPITSLISLTLRLPDDIIDEFLSARHLLSLPSLKTLDIAFEEPVSGLGIDPIQLEELSIVTSTHEYLGELSLFERLRVLTVSCDCWRGPNHPQRRTFPRISLPCLRELTLRRCCGCIYAGDFDFPSLDLLHLTYYGRAYPVPPLAPRHVHLSAPESFDNDGDSDYGYSEDGESWREGIIDMIFKILMNSKGTTRLSVSGMDYEIASDAVMRFWMHSGLLDTSVTEFTWGEGDKGAKLALSNEENAAGLQSDTREAHLSYGPSEENTELVDLLKRIDGPHGSG